MLSSLQIENVAVIQKADVHFEKGLNVLTGETGAGKSILIDSINAILGSRTSRELVRTGASKAVIRAAFDHVPVAVQDIDTKEVILIAYTNRQAMELTFKTRTLTLWSTSRNVLWEKGKTSGETFEVLEARVNCEQNSLVYLVRPRRGAICHTKNKAGKPRNCYYRAINLDDGVTLTNLDP